MKSLPQFKIAANPVEDERVLELFRNRAELKKAYSDLQDEVHALKDRLKQQEGVTERVQAMLDELEARLESPETAYSALVFYALRRLWLTGGQLLSQFAAQLHDQALAAETRAFTVDCNRKRFERRREMEAGMNKARKLVEEAEQNLAALEAERRRLSMPWHYLQRKNLDPRIGIARAVLRRTQSDLEPVRQAFASFEREPEAAFPGLSIQARREINLAIVACAEALCQRLATTPLVALAKASSVHRTCVDLYGDRRECESLLDEIGGAAGLLGAAPPTLAELKPRIDRLGSAARYRSPDCVLPIEESLRATPVEDKVDLDFSRGARGKSRASQEPPPNVLGEDTWDLLRVLLA